MKLRIRMMKKQNITLALIGLLTVGGQASAQMIGAIEQNGMTVTWRVMDERMYFKLSAPTTGWLAIGFNETKNLAGTYLLMTRVRNGEPEVIEHYTQSPGTYRPISDLGSEPSVGDVIGSQSRLSTTVEFSIPIKRVSKYHKELINGDPLNMLMAFSRHTDFQHHSIMRTSVRVNFNE